jgi:hypothetical protein
MVMELLEGAKSALEVAPAVEEPWKDIHEPQANSIASNALVQEQKPVLCGPMSTSTKSNDAHHGWIHGMLLYIHTIYAKVWVVYCFIFQKLWRRST